MSEKPTEAHMQLLDLHKRNRGRCAGKMVLDYLVAGKIANATFLAVKYIYKSSLHMSYLFSSQSKGQTFKSKKIGQIRFNI